MTCDEAMFCWQIGLMLMAMLNCTLILVIILKHDCSQPTGSTMTPTQVFLDFWETRCEEDWQSSFKQFRMGESGGRSSCVLVCFVLTALPIACCRIHL